MHALVLLSLWLAAGDGAPAEIQLTIFRDPYTSSDQVTLCRVRAVNVGSRSWSGHSLRFEARATDGGRLVRQRGRFGLELGPHEALETIVAFPGRHQRFEVELLSADDRERESPPPSGKKRRRARHGGRVRKR
jgi:hypothetical protein